MADVQVSKKARRLNISPKFVGVSRVIVHTGAKDENGAEIIYIAGDTTGRTIEVENPFASQAIAEGILNKLKGSTYQPYEAEGAKLHPAVEIGDSVSVGDVYSGVYARDIKFGRLYRSKIAAPYDEEIDHEYSFETSTDRKYTRKFNEVSASISINAAGISANARAISDTNSAVSDLSVRADGIAASVTSEETRAKAAEGGKLDHTNNSQSFGWSLNSSSFQLKNNNTTVFYFDKDGLKFKSGGADVLTVSRNGGLYVKGNGEFTGKISATSGYIGNGSEGFTIGSKSIYNGISSMNAKTQPAPNGVGIFLSVNGIRLGDKFFVTPNGEATIEGKITAKSGTIGGFTIGQKSIYNNLTWGGSQTTGVYIGERGLQLGQNFKVDSSGNLTANSGKFLGEVYAKNITHGGAGGTLSGGAITPQTLGTAQLTKPVTGALSTATYAGEVFGGTKVAEYCKAKWITSTGIMSANKLYMGDDGTDESGGMLVNTHRHKISADSSGKVTIGEPTTRGVGDSFNIADTKYFKDAVSAVSLASLTATSFIIDGNDKTISVGDVYTDYNGALRARIKFNLSNGKEYYGRVSLNASKAFKAGEDSVDVEESGGDYDIWVDGTQTVYGHRFAQIKVNLTNGKTITSAWLDCGSI